MTKMNYKKLAASIIFAAIAIIVIGCNDTRAGAFKDLSAVKQEAWKQCEWKTCGIPVDYKEAFENIDGAVRKDGEVYMSVADWTDKGISKGGEIPVFSSSTSNTVIAVLKEETIVNVLEHEADRLLIQSGFVSGYVDGNKLLCAEQAREQADKVCPEQILTDMSDTMVYKTTEAEEVLCYLQQRYSYDIMEKLPGWHRISVDCFEETRGYVRSSDVKIVRRTWLAGLNSGYDIAELHMEIAISETEREYLAALVWCEAGGESFEGQAAVVSTVLNRVEDARFPDTVEEVIRQKGQFIPVETGWYDEVLKEKTKIKNSCFEAVDYVLQGKRTIDTLYFDQAGVGTQIGSHWFY